jgi:hypothetical protein
MAVEYFEQSDKPVEYYDLLTGWNPDYRYTWPLHLTLKLAGKGYDVIFMDTLDLKKLARNPRKTLVDTYGQAVADDQIAHSNMKGVVRDALALVKNKNVKFKAHIPHYENITELLDDRYLVICNVNAKALDGAEGYSGHFVLVYGHLRKPDRLVVHNPGLPARARQVVPRKLFEKAWAHGGDEYKNILALKR